MAMSGKEFVKKIQKENQPLFEASMMNVRTWFQDPARTKEELLLHFQGRMANEYMNLVGVAAAVANIGTEVTAEEMALLSKQAHDEAVHFRLVKEVIEHIAGEKIDTKEWLDREFSRKANDKGASTLKTFATENDEVALACYQIVAEGRAATSWQTMADIGAVDPFVANKYARIARDERFHSSIGGLLLAKLADNNEEVQERALKIVDQMRKDLYNIIVGNTWDSPGARDLAAAAYGW